MACEVIARWKKAVRGHYGPTASSKWHKLYTDVQCVQLGLKPSFILDYLPPDSHNFQLFLQEVLQYQGSDTHSNELCILTLTKDVILTNLSSLGTMFRDREHDQLFVNITKGLASPEILSQAATAKVEGELIKWYEKLSGTLKMKRDAGLEGLPIVSAEVDESGMADCPLNVSTLFGRLLDYPVVYWFDSKVGYSLDMEDLVCHTVSVHSPTTAVDPSVKVHNLAIVTI